MASKFAQFLTDNKIDPRRLVVASKRIERLTDADRALKLKQRQTKKSGGAAAEGEKPAKPRSGRPVTPRLIAAAQGGKAVAGPAKTRLLRAVNQVLTQRKKDQVELRAIF